MPLTTAEKAQVMEVVRRSPQDTGSAEVQIALLTAEIQQLTQHLQTHKHDFHSRRGLMQKVGLRKRLLKYLQRSDNAAYQKIVNQLQLRG